MPPSRDTYKKSLETLATFLKTPRTIRAICERFTCSKPAAHERLAALVRAGRLVDGVKVREGSTGPQSTAWVVRNSATGGNPATPGKDGTKIGGGSRRAPSGARTSPTRARSGRNAGK